jgi:hypothetical protein
MNNYRLLAVMLDTLALWAADKIAGGVSTKWVSHQMISAVQYVAELARLAEIGGRLEHQVMLLPDDPPGGETP